MSGHWYMPDGTRVEPRTVVEARAMGALPSVTTIIGSVWPAPELDRWKIDNLLTSVRQLGAGLDYESEEEWKRRMIKHADGIRQTAADWGIGFHALVQGFLQGRSLDQVPQTYDGYIDHFITWWNRSGAELIASEEPVVNVQEGYAGTVDIIYRAGDASGLSPTVVCDIKTRELRDKPPQWYDEQAMQLAAYGQCLENPPDQWLSLIVNRDRPESPHEHWWTEAAIAKGWRRFLACRDLWRLANGFSDRQ